MSENRTPRDLETREKSARPTRWRRAALLPDPKPREGWSHHWVRVGMRGEPDAKNIAEKFQEGWEPVLAKDYPEIKLFYTEGDRFKDNIVIGGLMLCRAPVEMTQDRRRQMDEASQAQIVGADNDLMRLNDPRMPLFKEHKTRVTSFGRGE